MRPCAGAGAARRQGCVIVDHAGVTAGIGRLVRNLGNDEIKAAKYIEVLENLLSLR